MAQLLTKCDKIRIGYEFLNEHNFPQTLHTPIFNRCFCEGCYSKNFQDTYKVGSNLYVIPRGWVRFGLHVDAVMAKHLDLWNWSNCFHGTSIDNANSIIEHRMMLLPGERKMDGKVIEIPKNHLPHQYYFFTTPTIKYARLYAKLYEFISPTDRKKYNIRVCLQCKQKPESFVVQSKTISTFQSICPYVPDDQMEWKTENRASIMPYGILLLVTPCDEENVAVKKIVCPKCKTINVLQASVENEYTNVTCSNKECLCKFDVVTCKNCSISSTFEKLGPKSVFVCSNDKCSKRYEQLLQRRGK